MNPADEPGFGSETVASEPGVLDEWEKWVSLFENELQLTFLLKNLLSVLSFQPGLEEESGGFDSLGTREEPMRISASDILCMI